VNVDPDDGRAYALAVGVRLRDIRRQRGQSLLGVELASDGRWTVAAVGGYERADRALAAVRLCELAAFYRVPVSALLPAGEPPRRTRIDLVKLQLVPREHSGLINRWVQAIRVARGDWAGDVLTVRRTDLRALAVLHDTTPDEIETRMRGWGVLRGAAGDEDRS
jgi:transcriptional regulator with XRE-family HTH domain